MKLNAIKGKRILLILCQNLNETASSFSGIICCSDDSMNRSNDWNFFVSFELRLSAHRIDIDRACDDNIDWKKERPIQWHKCFQLEYVVFILYSFHKETNAVVVLFWICGINNCVCARATWRDKGPKLKWHPEMLAIWWKFYQWNSCWVEWVRENSAQFSMIA